MIPKIVHNSWTPLFQQQHQVLEAIRKSLSTNICPEPKLVFRAFSLPVEKVKVMIMLLSPYGTKVGKVPHATGLAMGVPNREMSTPTLSMVLESLWKYCGNIAIEESFDYTLESWEEQGIMLINAALTVPYRGDADRHVLRWRPFIKAYIDFLREKTEDTIFVFLGNTAKVFSTLVDNPITACHPVATHYQLSRTGHIWEDIPEHLNFVKAEVFKKIDERLSEPINWDNSTELPFNY